MGHVLTVVAMFVGLVNVGAAFEVLLHCWVRLRRSDVAGETRLELQTESEGR